MQWQPQYLLSPSCWTVLPTLKGWVCPMYGPGWWCETVLSSSFPSSSRRDSTKRQRAGASELPVLRLWRRTLRAVRSSLKPMPHLLVSWDSLCREWRETVTSLNPLTIFFKSPISGWSGCSREDYFSSCFFLKKLSVTVTCIIQWGIWILASELLGGSLSSSKTWHRSWCTIQLSDKYI